MLPRCQLLLCPSSKPPIRVWACSVLTTEKWHWNKYTKKRSRLLSAGRNQKYLWNNADKLKNSWLFSFIYAFTCTNACWEMLTKKNSNVFLYLGFTGLNLLLCILYKIVKQYTYLYRIDFKLLITTYKALNNLTFTISPLKFSTMFILLISHQCI